jgi:hypothetical protein
MPGVSTMRELGSKAKGTLKVGIRKEAVRVSEQEQEREEEEIEEGYEEDPQAKVQEPDGHAITKYQCQVAKVWFEGLLQRTSGALAANTGLIMCPKDIDALSFAFIALDCVDIPTLHERLNISAKEEMGKPE